MATDLEKEIMGTKCIDCENEHIEKYSDLYIDYYNLKEYSELLEKSLDANEKLLNFFRQENAQLKTRLEVYKDDRD